MLQNKKLPGEASRRGGGGVARGGGPRGADPRGGGPHLMTFDEI